MSGRNTYRILNVVGDPLHASMIAWLLEPRAEHRLGDALLQRLVGYLRKREIYWPGPGRDLGETRAVARGGSGQQRVHEVVLTAPGDTRLVLVIGGHEPGALGLLEKRRAEEDPAVGMAVIPGALAAKHSVDTPIWGGLDLLHVLREVEPQADPYAQAIAQYAELLEDLVGHRRGERPSGVYELSEIAREDPGTPAHALFDATVMGLDAGDEDDFGDELELNLEQEMLPSDDMSRVYLVEKLLGRGGQGYVFQVSIQGEQEFEAFKRPVSQAVLKIAREGHAESLIREREVYSVPNPGIVKLLDSGTANDAPYLVLEKLHPHPGAWFGGVPVDPATAIDIFVNLLVTLRGIHGSRECPLLLLDIKPDNFMLRMSNAEGEISDEEYLTRLSTGAYEPVFMDMGIARPRREVEKSGGRLDQLVGTAVYLPPEAYPSLSTEQLGQYSEATDVYALTLAFYELLTGARAYEHRGVYELKGQDRLFELIDFKLERVDPVDPQAVHRAVMEGDHEVLEVLRLGLHPDPDLRGTVQRLLDLCKASFGVIERRKREVGEYHYDMVKGVRLWQSRYPRINPERNAYYQR